MKLHRLIQCFIFMGILGLTGQVGADGGITLNGLQIQLVPLQQVYVLGQPMKFRVNIINQSENPVTLKYTADDVSGDDFYILGPGEVHVDATGSGEYPAKNYTLQLSPGVSKTLIKVRDLNAEYAIRLSGKYTFQYVQKIWDQTSTQFPPSNTVEITVIKNKQ
jgi:hypothetical protein